MDTHSELFVELVGEQRVGQLTEVQLTQRAHAVDVLHVQLFRQVRNVLAVKLVPEGGIGGEQPVTFNASGLLTWVRNTVSQQCPGCTIQRMPQGKSAHARVR